MQKITKLVLPVAGRGTRLWPLTRRTPKNLVRVAGRPMIEHVLLDAERGGVEEIILIVSPAHRGSFESYVSAARNRFPRLKFFVREQEVPGGNGHALAQAHDLLGDSPFLVRFCDDVFLDEAPISRSLAELYSRHGGPVVLLERVSPDKVSRFGVVEVEKIGAAGDREAPRGAVYKIKRIVEKPRVEEAPSNLTVVGGYVLTPRIVENLKRVSSTLPKIAEDALPLAVALEIDLLLGGNIYGWEFPGRRLDCGTLESLREAEKHLKNP